MNTPSHGHNPALQHHFDTPGQQREAATLGMWLFLTTEIMLFGGIFMAYTVYRWAYPTVWTLAATHLNTPLATLNTVVLLMSSLSVALAVHAATQGQQRQVVRLLLLTLVLGAIFLGVKFSEYGEKFAHCAGYSNPIAWLTGGEQLAESECLVPGRSFHFPAAHSSSAGEAEASEINLQTSPQLFYFLYFCATGLHAIHMFIGIGVISWLTWMAARARFSPTYYTPIEIGGLYWHLIDIIWVFLFPLFYLV